MQWFSRGNAGRSDAVVAGGLVCAVATDPENASQIAVQTVNTLAKLEQLLLLAGSDKTKIIQAKVYLTDIADKAAMDAVWCAWIGSAENWLQRACIGVKLFLGDLIEVVVTDAGS